MAERESRGQGFPPLWSISCVFCGGGASGRTKLPDLGVAVRHEFYQLQESQYIFRGWKEIKLASSSSVGILVVCREV